MPTDVPIACSLTADDLPARMADAAMLGRQGLLDVSTTGARAELRFKADAREEVDRFVAAESECCPFFRFEQRDEEETTVLSIEGPEEGTPVLRGVVAGVVAGWEMAA